MYRELFNPSPFYLNYILSKNRAIQVTLADQSKAYLRPDDTVYTVRAHSNDAGDRIFVMSCIIDNQEDQFEFIGLQAMTDTLEDPNNIELVRMVAGCGVTRQDLTAGRRWTLNALGRNALFLQEGFRMPADQEVHVRVGVSVANWKDVYSSIEIVYTDHYGNPHNWSASPWMFC